MWRQRNSAVRFRPKDGMAVLVRARVGLYEPRGEYQLHGRALEEAGEGALKREFEQLKAEARRRRIVCRSSASARCRAVPRRIGVVTSPTGAAIHDILRRAARALPGGSGADLSDRRCRARPRFRRSCAPSRPRRARSECDVLIVARGGGSLEDLWCFNDERVARAIAACRMPTISGVGHEVDVTIADFVADLRAPTPSAAALAADAGQIGVAGVAGTVEHALRRRHGPLPARPLADPGRARAAPAGFAPRRAAAAARAAARRSRAAAATGAARGRHGRNGSGWTPSARGCGARIRVIASKRCAHTRPRCGSDCRPRSPAASVPWSSAWRWPRARWMR